MRETGRQTPDARRQTPVKAGLPEYVFDFTGVWRLASGVCPCHCRRAVPVEERPLLPAEERKVMALLMTGKGGAG
jgi:hypothetical protein